MNLSIGRLFSSYVALVGKPDLSDDEKGDLEKITKALEGKSFPEKIHFYRGLTNHDEKLLFLQDFIELNV
jgi:hypothetical protein